MPATDRSKQSKPVARSVATGVRKPIASVYYHGRNTTDHTITLSIRGQRYEYFLTPTQADTVEHLCKRGLGRRALNYAKSRAWNVLKVGAQTSATSTS